MKIGEKDRLLFLVWNNERIVCKRLNKEIYKFDILLGNGKIMSFGVFFSFIFYFVVVILNGLFKFFLFLNGNYKELFCIFYMSEMRIKCRDVGVNIL